MIIIGIDEAGRGPWAGPLVVAGVRTSDTRILSRIPGLDDSKKLSPQKREIVFAMLEKLAAEGCIDIFVEVQSSATIDQIGIREANRRAMQSLLMRVDDAIEAVYIDGADNFEFAIPGYSYYFAQKKNSKKKQSSCLGGKREIHFVIGGDATHPVISAASIVAKFWRDRLMDDIALQYPEYGFASHKGYGTHQHHQAIIDYGIISEHRKSYMPIKRLLSGGSGLL